MRSRLGFPPSDPVPSLREVLAAETRSLLDEHGREVAAAARRRLTFREWVSTVPEPDGPLDFRRFPFQVELYDEAMAHDAEVVIQKATQVGVSGLMVRWALFHADVFGRVALYAMPSRGDLLDFSRQRIGPVVRASHLKARIARDAVDTVAQRQVGAGWLYMRGTNRPIDSVNAGVVVFDEYDSSNQLNIEESERRISSPTSAGLLRRVGVPRHSASGISAAFEATDQRLWSVKCGACGTWARLRGHESFVANFDQEELRLRCAKCRHTLDVLSGEWVATYPDRDVRGYHIPKLVTPDRRALAMVVANSRKTRPDQVAAFHTHDLGEPWAAAENRLSIEQVRACVDDEMRLPASVGQWSDRLIYLGCDVASARALNVVVEEIIDDRRGRRIYAGEVEDGPDGSVLEQLSALMRRFNVSMAAIDHAPERRLSEAFAAAFPGQVYLVGYKNPGPSANAAAWDVDDANHHVTVWRTLAIDAMLERFRSRAVELPPLEMLPADYPAHLGALVRQTEEMTGGQIRAAYRRLGPDDYAHAEVYLLTAIELMWRRIGLSRAVSQGPVPLLEPGVDYEPLDLTGPLTYDDWRYG